jgi:Mn-dependent DtxR family transcriptional regulator
MARTGNKFIGQKKIILDIVRKNAENPYLTQQYIANMMGINKGIVSKAVKELQADGKIVIVNVGNYNFLTCINVGDDGG